MRLQQILLNLGNNAIKFTNQGRIDFFISYAIPTSGGVSLRFEVRDTGIGIPANQIDNIFQRFVQIDSQNKRRFGGTGLGLAIVNALVQAMNGMVGVESEPEQGSLFWFILNLEVAPDDQQSIRAASEEKSSCAGYPLAGLRILVAEDQEINQEVLLDLLHKLGAETALATDGNEAVAKIITTDIHHEKPFDLILMDIQMPVMDGITATQILRKSYQFVDLPIIAISAGVQSSERSTCLKAGMNDFIAKPFNIKTLCQIIQHHCHKLSRQKDFSFQNNQTISKRLSLPGFDLTGAIDNLGGDTTTYIRLANLFLNRIQEIRNNLHEQLQNNSPEGTNQVAKLLHSLRGSALTLGAVELADATKIAETAVTTQESVDREQLWMQLDKAFERVLTVLPELLKDIAKQ